MAKRFDRIPFEEAISEPLLFKKPWLELSGPQRVILKAIYGLDLSEEELVWWTILQGPETYIADHLGYPQRIIKAVPYNKKEYEECWAILGRRSGKSYSYLAFVAAYEAMLGGHTRFISKKQQSRIFVVAQKLDLAQAIINEFIEPICSCTPLLEKEIVKVNSDGIVLRNRQIIAPAPPHIKPFRGFAVPVVAMDEVAFWYKDSESANPDYEVERAVSKAQAQFPDRKRIGASTPWSKEGLLYDARRAGTCGNRLDPDDEQKLRFKHALVVHAPTPAMEVPLIGMDRAYFQKEYDRDTEGYNREFLANFVDAVSGLFTEEQIREAQKNQPSHEQGREALPRAGFEDDITPFYIAAIDPAFRRDRFAFCIGHYEPKRGFVQDHLQWWTPQDGMPINPAFVLDCIKDNLARYKVSMLFSDQYQLESLQQLALDRGFVIQGVDFTSKSKAKIYGNLLTLFRTGKVCLLKCEEQTKELLMLERHNSASGNISISGRANSHDDLATVVALCAQKVIWMMPKTAEEVAKVDQHKSPTPHERIMAHIISQKRLEKMLDRRRIRGYD